MVILGSFSPSIELSGLWGHFTIRFEGSFWDYSSSYFWLKQILPQYPKVHPTLSIFIETINFYKKNIWSSFKPGSSISNQVVKISWVNPTNWLYLEAQWLCGCQNAVICLEPH